MVDDGLWAMPSARAATPSGLSRFASSCSHRIAIADEPEICTNCGDPVTDELLGMCTSCAAEESGQFGAGA
jgi:hypothetical protein